MDALILAAGLGSRIRGLSGCKPLTPVGGRPLVELAIRAVARAGAKRVVVVTGYRAEQVEAALPAIAAAVDVAVEPHRIAHYDRPNGFSVIAGASRMAGDYLLTMADHVLSPGIPRGLSRQGGPDRGVTLAIDRRIGNRLIDPGDATWVHHGRPGRIARIGKHLVQYDAADCGAFLATPELADAIAAAIAAGRPGSLSDGVQALADAGRAATMDIGSEWWIDVDDPMAHALAENLLASRMDELAEASVCVMAGVPGAQGATTTAPSGGVGA